MSKIVQTARRLAIALGWASPFFAIPAAKVRFFEDANGAHTETACVYPDGRIYFNPTFCGELSTAELQFVIAHEIMHLLMRHAGRRGDRIPKLWNIAGDMAINEALRQARQKGQNVSYQAPAGALFPAPERAEWHAERIYDALLQDAQSGGGDGDAGDGDPAPGQGCGVKPASGPGGEGDGEGGDSAKSSAELDREWTEVAAQAQAMGRSAGDGAGNVLANLCELPAARVRWGAILRRGMASALATHGRDAQTWTRRGRRSAAVGPQFPGWQANAARCAVIIDTSGSMSDEELAQCVAETLKIAQESGVAVYLVTHDHGVQWSGWLAARCRPGAVTQAVKGRGGTCAREAYRIVAEASPRFDAVIHLTDGALAWPHWPANARHMVVALIGYGCNGVPDGARVIEVGKH